MAPTSRSLAALEQDRPKRGRPKGSRTSYGKLGREIALKLVTNKDYLERVERRLRSGELSPSLEAVLWSYAFGRPADTDLNPDRPRSQGAVINVITSSSTQNPEKQIGQGRTTTIVTSQPSVSQPANQPDQPNQLATKPELPPGDAKSSTTPVVIDVSAPSPAKKTPKNSPNVSKRTQRKKSGLASDKGGYVNQEPKTGLEEG